MKENGWDHGIEVDVAEIKWIELMEEVNRRWRKLRFEGSLDPLILSKSWMLLAGRWKFG